MTEEEVRSQLKYKAAAEMITSMDTVKEFLSSIPGIVSPIIVPDQTGDKPKSTRENLILADAWKEEINKNLDKLKEHLRSYRGCPTFLATKFFEGKKNDLMDYQIGFYLNANSGSEFLPIGYGLYADFIKGSEP